MHRDAIKFDIEVCQVSICNTVISQKYETNTTPDSREEFSPLDLQAMAMNYFQSHYISIETVMVRGSRVVKLDYNP